LCISHLQVLPSELQLIIAKKIAASSTRELLAFRASAKLYQRLSENPVVLIAVSEDCLHLLILPSPNAGHMTFMQQLTLNGHALYCIVKAAQMLHQPYPNLHMIQSVLRNFQNAGSDEATYFLIMLKVLKAKVLTEIRFIPSFMTFSLNNVLLTVEAASIPMVFSLITVDSNYILCPQVWTTSSLVFSMGLCNEKQDSQFSLAISRCRRGL